MKFRLAKSDNITCHNQKCMGIIMRGDTIVQNFIRNGNGSVTVLTYHAACYLPWYEDMFNRKYTEWKRSDGNTARPPRGRPILHTDADKGTRMNRLKTLLNYHSKLGHAAKVLLIQKQIDFLS